MLNGFLLSDLVLFARVFFGTMALVIMHFGCVNYGELLSICFLKNQNLPIKYDLVDGVDSLRTPAGRD